MKRSLVPLVRDVDFKMSLGTQTRDSLNRIDVGNELLRLLAISLLLVLVEVEALITSLERIATEGLVAKHATSIVLD